MNRMILLILGILFITGCSSYITEEEATKNVEKTIKNNAAKYPARGLFHKENILDKNHAVAKAIRAVTT